MNQQTSSLLPTIPDSSHLFAMPKTYASTLTESALLTNEFLFCNLGLKEAK